MEPTKIISGIFSVIFLVLLYVFIFRALRLMRADFKAEKSAPLQSGAPRWGLEVVETPAGSRLKKGMLIPLKSGMTLGRKKDNTIVLEDPYVSYYHVRFFVHDERFVIEDLNSTNGTLLNGGSLAQKTYLRINDLITLGETTLRVVS
ncbi:hypothetical protein ABB02_01089 [Clostridiaceae bacterium JG1575]|nr:hypothetical protein ABB02_01089 [Clostridiaceae bacterium JG1575]